MNSVRFSLVFAALLTPLLVHGSAHATSSLSDLGKPTSDLPAYYDDPGGFKRIGTVHRRAATVIVSLFDAPWDNNSAGTRWPLVKALGEFGTWSGLQPGEATLPLAVPVQSPSGGTIPGAPPFPTYDLTHARYYSRYVRFARTVVQVTKGGPHAHLSGAQLGLFSRALRVPVALTQEIGVQNIDTQLPAIVAGAFAMHGPSVALFGMLPGSALDHFHLVQQQMQQGDRGTGAVWVRQANTFVNAMVAYICYQDGMRPVAVCHRWAVRQIMLLPHFVK